MEDIAERTIGKIYRRLVPLLIACVIVGYIDRVNVGFAALVMNRDLGFSALTYGTGAGIFFIGYVAFGIPSNLVLERIGARRMLGTLMVAWGLISMATAFITGPTSFYVMRFLLGVMEAGFIPGMAYYVTSWTPSAYRGRFFGPLLAAAPVSGVIGSPVSGAILSLGDAFGLRSWQILFLIEGLPAIILGVVIWKLLSDRPRAAPWLSPAEQSWLAAAAEQAPPDRSAAAAVPLLQKFSPMAVMLGFMFFGLAMSNYGVLLWLPQIVKAFGLSNLAVGFVAAIPYVVGAVGAIYWARHSDQRRERPLHIAAAAFLAGISFLLVSLVTAPVLSMLFLTIATIGIYAGGATFWSLPGECLAPRHMAAGVAVANCIGNLGGFTGPYLIGYVKETTGSFTMAMLALCLVLLASGGVALLARLRIPQAKIAAPGHP